MVGFCGPCFSATKLITGSSFGGSPVPKFHVHVVWERDQRALLVTTFTSRSTYQNDRGDATRNSAVSWRLALLIPYPVSAISTGARMRKYAG